MRGGMRGKKGVGEVEEEEEGGGEVEDIETIEEGVVGGIPDNLITEMGGLMLLIKVEIIIIKNLHQATIRETGTINLTNNSNNNSLIGKLQISSKERRGRIIVRTSMTLTILLLTNNNTTHLHPPPSSFMKGWMDNPHHHLKSTITPNHKLHQ